MNHYWIDTAKGKEGRISVCANVAAVAIEHRGWVAGPFVKDTNGEPFVSSFEVKDAHHKAGDERTEWSTPMSGETWVLMLSGEQKITFCLDGVEKTVVLTGGQSVAFDGTVPHKWRMLTDSHVLTVRRS